MSWNKDQFKKYDTSEGYGNSKQWRKSFGQRMGFDEAKQILESQAETPRAILGVSDTATKDEIKSAYRKLVKIFHPDKYFTTEEILIATERMKKINAAYTYLTEK